MKYCPKCGTANRDGSRFCNECGEELGTQTRIKCPHCGAMNPVQNLFCSECRGRLLPPPTQSADATPAIKGLSLPTKAAGDGPDEEGTVAGAPEEKEETPAWLQELGTSLPAEEGSTESTPLEDVSEVPDWLRDLRASLPLDSEEGYPTEEDEAVPDWLAGLRPSAAGEEVEPGPVAEEEVVLDWGAESQPSAYEAELESTDEAEEEAVPDWRAEPQPSAERTEPELDVEPEADEVPDWLAGLRASATEAESEPDFEAEPQEMPDWLAELRASAAEAESEPDFEAEPQEMPDWLAESRPSIPEAEAEPMREAEEEAVPDWWAEPQPPAERTEPELDVETEAEELPDWLAELRASATEAESELDFEAEPGEMPDWLAELRASAAEAESEPDFEVEAGEMPDWLAESQPAPSEEESIGPVAAEEVPQVPAWLEELQLAVPEEVLPPLEEVPLEDESLEWLVPFGQDFEGDDFLAPAEIPAWLLALKPAELREEGEDEGLTPAFEEATEETGLLAGLHGTLPVEMIIAQPRAATRAETVALLPAETPQAHLFAEILGQPPVVAPREIAPPRRRLFAPLPGWLVSIVLIAAVSLPLLLGDPLITRTIEPAPAVVDLNKAIDTLESDAAVLVAFDYDPTTSGEMDVLAQALVGHLMDRGARVVAVSLLPAGPATAQRVLDMLAAERLSETDSYGERYANLGYLPGQASGVRLLGLSIERALPRDFYGTPSIDLTVMEGVSGIQDFDLIVELAATQDTLRWWIEQASTPFNTPLAAGVSASVDPLARPYYETESDQLVGMVSGVPGAVIYQALYSGQESPVGESGARLDSQLAGHLIFILLLLVGNGVYFLQRGSGRER